MSERNVNSKEKKIRKKEQKKSEKKKKKKKLRGSQIWVLKNMKQITGKKK